MKNRNDIFYKELCWSVFLVFLFLLILVKSIQLQIFSYKYTDNYIDKKIYNEIIKTPKRGNILDRNGSILVMSVPKYNVFLDAVSIKNLRELEKFLLSINIKLSNKNLQDIKNNKRYIPIAFELDKTIVDKIKDYKKTKKDFSIGIEEHFIRLYPEGNMLSHVLGIVDKNGTGLEGIEKICDLRLAGQKVKVKRQKLGKRNLNEEFLDEKALTGSDVWLTIDKRIQFIAEQELEQGIKKKKAKNGTIIVQNPYTGEILAMASYPNYNPASKISNINVLRNPAISFVREPGSTFKIIVASAALEEKVFKPADKINCENGRFKVGKDIIKDHEKKGFISFSQVIEYSSNIGTAKIALKLGSEKFYKYIRLFGFGSKTGIDLNGEEGGLLKDPSLWSGRSLHTISFGQEIATTPIQTINSFSAIANGGTLMKPLIIKSIGGIDYEKVPPGRRVMSEEVSSKMRQILRGVIDNGTGKSAKIEGYSVAGKTGTAQKADRKTGKYSTKYYLASFCGFVPATNPQVVILVMIDEPDGDYYAASVATPIFAKVAERIMTYLNVEKDEIVKNKIKGKE